MVGGGINTDDDDLFVASSYPADGLWVIELESEGDIDRNPAPLESYAVCIPARGGPPVT